MLSTVHLVGKDVMEEAEGRQSGWGGAKEMPTL